MVPAELSICHTCGVQYAASERPPETCPICEDARQWVPAGGQRWTTMAELAATHVNTVRRDGELIGIGTEPRFAIGQRALVVPSAIGNVLWECVTLLDDATAEAVEALGGLAAIAISHPHYYSVDGRVGAPLRLPGAAAPRRRAVDHAPATRRSSCGRARRASSAG